MLSNCRTSAPRSAIVHAVGGTFTVCGRRIGEGWAGEYSAQPAGDVNCARCVKGIAAKDAELAARAEYAIGTRVGILTGVQSVSGPWVHAYGTVVRHVEFWRGTVEYIVRTDDGAELSYRGFLLTVEFAKGDRVTVYSPQMADHGRTGAIVAVTDDTLTVHLDGDAMAWNWHKSHIVKAGTREACMAAHPSSRRRTATR